ncbi:MAG: hypothetical protein ACQEWW_16900 [Bacillota bacterium]
MEKGTEKTIITNDNGKIIATIHGKLNIDILANFFIKTPIQPNKKDTRQTA